MHISSYFIQIYGHIRLGVSYKQFNFNHIRKQPSSEYSTLFKFTNGLKCYYHQI